MKNIKKLQFITIALFFLFPTSSFAATTPARIYFSVPNAVHVGDTFSVLVNADTKGVLINSINLNLTYDQSLMSFAGYKDDETLVKIWINAPKDNSGVISMSGIIPGGVSGLYDPNRQGLSPIPLVRLLFTAKEVGSASLSFTKTQILKHDGKGTELDHTDQDGSVNIIKGMGNNIAADSTVPDTFILTFVESSLFSRTPDMIVFNASDAGSGIKEYKMQINSGAWQNAESPQPIIKSLFSRDIVVRAFDFHGNYRDAVITIPGVVPITILLVIFILIVLSGILALKLLKYKHEITPHS